MMNDDDADADDHIIIVRFFESHDINEYDVAETRITLHFFSQPSHVFWAAAPVRGQSTSQYPYLVISRSFLKTSRIPFPGRCSILLLLFRLFSLRLLHCLTLLLSSPLFGNPLNPLRRVPFHLVYRNSLPTNVQAHPIAYVDTAKPATGPRGFDFRASIKTTTLVFWTLKMGHRSRGMSDW